MTNPPLVRHTGPESVRGGGSRHPTCGQSESVGVAEGREENRRRADFDAVRFDAGEVLTALVKRQVMRPTTSEKRTMRRPLILTLALALFLAVGVSTPGASSKFSYSEEIAANASLVVSFQEGSLRRFESVEYRLDATADVTLEQPGQTITVRSTPTASTTLVPDARGGTQGVLTLDVDITAGGCLCGGTALVEYSSVTLTNLATGKIYRLEPINRTFPG
jgi:hypothetical protein